MYTYILICYILYSIRPIFVLRISFQEVWLSQILIFKGWKASVSRESPGKFAPRIRSRKILSMKIARRPNGTPPCCGACGQTSYWEATLQEVWLSQNQCVCKCMFRFLSLTQGIWAPKGGAFARGRCWILPRFTAVFSAKKQHFRGCASVRISFSRAEVPRFVGGSSGDLTQNLFSWYSIV